MATAAATVVIVIPPHPRGLRMALGIAEPAAAATAAIVIVVTPALP
jgi:hypothetical protein